MPVYNEDTKRITAGFEATFAGFMATGEIAQFDFLCSATPPKPHRPGGAGGVAGTAGALGA